MVSCSVYIEGVFTMKKEAAFFAQFSTQQLEEMLRLGLSRPGNRYDEVLLQIMEVLQEREEERMEKETVEKAWEQFQTYYNTPERRGVELYGDSEELDRLLEKAFPTEKKEAKQEEKVVPIRPARRWPRLPQAVKVAVVTLVVTFSSITVAQAAGIDFYGMMGTWTDDIFQFRLPEDPTDSEQERVSKEFQAEINTMGVYLKLAPTWCPEGFEVYDLRHEGVDEEFDYVICEYQNKTSNKFYSVSVDVNYKSNWFLTNYEKDDTPIEIYKSNDRSFYIMSNIDTLTAVWSDGNIVVTIAGQLTKDEIKGVIDSIGG